MNVACGKPWLPSAPSQSPTMGVIRNTIPVPEVYRIMDPYWGLFMALGLVTTSCLVTLSCAGITS